MNKFTLSLGLICLVSALFGQTPQLQTTTQ